MAPIHILSPARARRRWNDIQSTLAVTQHGSPPRRADWVFAGLFLLLGVLEAVAEDRAGTPTSSAQLLVAVAAAAGVPWRRVVPPYALLVAVGLSTVLSGIVDDPEFGWTLVAFLSLVFMLYGLVRWRPEREVVIGVAVVILVEPLGAMLRTGVAGDVVSTFILLLLIGAAALLMRYRTVLQWNRLEQARLTERNVLARELHDSVAHYVSAIAVQAQAAQYVGRTNPEAAIAAMAEVEQTANRAIDEMRRMVGALRTSDDIARTVASTSLLDLHDPSIRPPVMVTGDVDLSELSPPVAAAAFRIAQESVTNARKHGRQASFINVSSTITEHEVVLQIVNDGVTGGSSSGGYGLVGMEERIRALGGEIVAGRAPHGCWSVVARVPLHGDGAGPS